MWAITAGGGETGNYPTLATEVSSEAFGLALLESIARARLLAREHGSAVILSWLGGETGGWRTDTVDTRQARLHVQGGYRLGQPRIVSCLLRAR